MPDVDDFDDDLEPKDEPDDLDAEALGEAERAAAAVSDNPDIDTPPVAGGSQAADVAGPPPELPSASDVLAGRVPVFLVARSYQRWQRIPEVLEVARRVTGGRIGLGTVVRLPRMTPVAASAFLGSCAHTSLRIADPEVYAIPSASSPADPITARQSNHHPWAAAIPAQGSTQAQQDAWIEQVLEAQVVAGANVLLSPTGWVTDQQAPGPLQAVLAWAARARQIAGADAPMFVNLTLAGGWLANPQLRAMLLTEIVESNEPLWYIRVRWPIIEPRYGQLIDPALLDGYRELAATARLEGKVLLLPNSGLTGWLATALGAAGFSTGMSWPEQAFADERTIRMPPGRPKPPDAQRYFERTALHPLLWGDVQNLAQLPGYRGCQCRYCRALRANGFDKEWSAAHYLVRAARLVDELGAVDRRTEALRIVRTARAFVNGMANTPNALSGAWLPGHLPLWEARLL